MNEPWKWSHPSEEPDRYVADLNRWQAVRDIGMSGKFQMVEIGPRIQSIDGRLIVTIQWDDARSKSRFIMKQALEPALALWPSPEAGVLGAQRLAEKLWTEMEEKGFHFGGPDRFK